MSKTIEDKPHPEKASNELFLTNTTAEQYPHIGWRTKRLGTVAYDVHGKAIEQGEWFQKIFPVFVRREEMEAAGFVIEETEVAA